MARAAWWQTEVNSRKSASPGALKPVAPGGSFMVGSPGRRGWCRLSDAVVEVRAFGPRTGQWSWWLFEVLSRAT